MMTQYQALHHLIDRATTSIHPLKKRDERRAFRTPSPRPLARVHDEKDDDATNEASSPASWVRDIDRRSARKSDDHVSMRNITNLKNEREERQKIPPTMNLRKTMIH